MGNFIWFSDGQPSNNSFAHVQQHVFPSSMSFATCFYALFNRKNRYLTARHVLVQITKKKYKKLQKSCVYFLCSIVHTYLLLFLFTVTVDWFPLEIKYSSWSVCFSDFFLFNWNLWQIGITIYHLYICKVGLKLRIDYLRVAPCTVYTCFTKTCF